MEKVWVTINDKPISLGDLPLLLDRYNLLPSFFEILLRIHLLETYSNEEDKKINIVFF